MTETPRRRPGRGFGAHDIWWLARCWQLFHHHRWQTQVPPDGGKLLDREDLEDLAEPGAGADPPALDFVEVSLASTTGWGRMPSFDSVFRPARHAIQACHSLRPAGSPEREFLVAHRTQSPTVRSPLGWSQTLPCQPTRSPLTGIQIAGIQIAGFQVTGIQIAGAEEVHAPTAQPRSARPPLVRPSSVTRSLHWWIGRTDACRGRGATCEAERRGPARLLRPAATDALAERCRRSVASLTGFA